MAEYPYDLFISYARADRAWVEGYLLDAMQVAGLRVHAEEAFHLGVPRLLEFQRAVGDSQRTLLVLSPAYLARGGFDQFFDLMAQAYDPDTRTGRVIPVILRPVEIPSRLATFTALDATTPDRWPGVIERLCAGLECPVPGPSPKPACPYPGMVPFTPGEARFFYGREYEIEELWRRLGQRYVFVIGPPGSGKSSLISAGLIPMLHEQQTDRWLVRKMRPGEDPLCTLAQALAVQGAAEPEDWEAAADALLADNAPCQKLLLVVDQFEEVFTQTPKEKWAPFFRAIHALRLAQNCSLVLALRDDFYPDLMTSELWPVYPTERLEITPLRSHDLRDAIALPAERQGIYLEAGLLEHLLVDAAEEPVVLPLVQETMRLLWQEMERRLLTVRAYERLGDPSTGQWQAGRSGLGVAIATRADATLAELSPEGQTIARRIFLRLVHFGEGRPDTCREQPVSALRAAGDDTALFEGTLQHLADDRLLTLSNKVDISHEVLITEWPTLRRWLEEGREGEQTRRRLEARAEEWLRLGGESRGLLDRTELLEAERWLASPDAPELGTSETLAMLVRASRSAQAGVAARPPHAPRFRPGALGVIAALIIIALGIGLWGALQNSASQGAVVEREKQRRQQEQQAAATAQALAGGEATARVEAEVSREAAVQAQATTIAQSAAALATTRAEADGRLEKAANLQATAEAYQLEAVAAQTRADAERGRTQVALARQLAGQALGQLNDLDQALLLSLEAYRIADEIGPVLDSTGMGDKAEFSAVELRRSLLAGLTSSPHLITFLHGHASDVNSLAFSPDGSMLASGSDDQRIVLWNLKNDPPEPIGDPLTGQDHRIMAVAFSPEGKVLASGGDDGAIFLWDVNTRQAMGVPLEGHASSVRSLAFSPTNERRLASGGDDALVILWDVETGERVNTLPGHSNGVESLAFSPDGRTLASASRDGTIRLWNAAAGTLLKALEGQADGVYSVAFSPDGEMLASGGRDGTIRLWNVEAGQPIGDPLSGHADRVNSLAFSPDTPKGTGGKILASSSLDGSIILWNVESGQRVGRPLTGHAGPVWTMAFSPAGDMLVSGGHDGAIIVWDPQRDLPGIARPLSGHEGAVKSVAFSPECISPSETSAEQCGELLASGSVDGSIRLWNAKTGEPLGDPLTQDGQAVNSVAFSPECVSPPEAPAERCGKLMASGGDGQTIVLWDVETRQPIGDPLKEHTGAINSLAFSPDGRILASGGADSTIVLWDVETHQPIGQPLEGHSGPVESVSFSPDDSEFLLSASRGRLDIGLWDARSGSAFTLADVYGVDGALSVAFGPDPEGRSFASGGADGRILLTTQGRERFLTGHTGGVNSLAFSPECVPVPPEAAGRSEDAAAGRCGLTLASGGADRSVILWDVPTGQTIGILAGHGGEVHSVAFSPDTSKGTGGKALASGGGDKIIILWDLSLDSWRAQACRIANRNLSLDEWNQFIGPETPYRRTCPDLPPGEGVLSDAAPGMD